MTLYVSVNIFVALGLSFLNPEFSENARAQMVGLIINAQIAAFASIGVFIMSTMFLDLDIFSTISLQIGIIGVLGLIFLNIGKRKLTKIE